MDVDTQSWSSKEVIKGTGRGRSGNYDMVPGVHACKKDRERERVLSLSVNPKLKKIERGWCCGVSPTLKSEGLRVFGGFWFGGPVCAKVLHVA